MLQKNIELARWRRSGRGLVGWTVPAVPEQEHRDPKICRRRQRVRSRIQQTEDEPSSCYG